MKQASRRQYHYIYKITRLDESGRYYIGMHSTDDLEDGYFGSGKLITRSINKHGKEKHQKEILEFLPSREALKLREKELVNKELLEDKRCMNLKLGGEGGFTSEQMQALWADPEYRQRVSKKQSDNNIKNWQDPEFRFKMVEIASSRFKKMWQDPEKRERLLEAAARSFKGKKHSEESKRQMALSAIGKQDKEKNSQFGTMWITNGTENKKIKKDDIIPEGWRKGREKVHSEEMKIVLSFAGKNNNPEKRKQTMMERYNTLSLNKKKRD